MAEDTFRVVCKLRDDVDLRDATDASWVWNEVLDKPGVRDQHPGITMTRLFRSSTSAELKAFTGSVSLASLEPSTKSARRRDPRLSNLNSCVLLTLPRTGNAALLTRQLLGMDAVDVAYVDPDYEPASPSKPDNDEFFAKQRYLNPDRGGMDVRSAWQKKGDGRGVSFADVEVDWPLGHRDLPPIEELTSRRGGGNIFEVEHGTQVLEVVSARDNTKGIIGIAPKINKVFVASILTTHVADAIQKAADRLRLGGGGVLLIELHEQGAGSLPVEASQIPFAAISQAAFQSPSSPVVVVECAGNGGMDLDSVVAAPGRRSLRRSAAPDEDSGAIMVGAVESGKTHRKLPASNFGSRVDCHAWGEDVFTSRDLNQRRGTFGMTSAAGAIIAGICCGVQSVHKQRRERFLTSVEMRALLRQFPSIRRRRRPALAGDDMVGPMPDLKRIIESIPKVRKRR